MQGSQQERTPAQDRTPAKVRSFHYPPGGIVRAVVRAAVGSFITLALWLATGASLNGAFFALPAMAVFFAYGIVAVLRGLSVVMIDETGISISGPLGGQVNWRQMTKLRLAFYATRRRPDFTRDGWMVLTARSGKKQISMESEINDFAEIANICRLHAQAAGVALSAATTGNFAALESGVPAPGRVRGLRSVLAQR
ncbi:MAG: hypothetical protein ACTSY1_07300 [Alphaproteobacteria bacterium]